MSVAEFLQTRLASFIERKADRPIVIQEPVFTWPEDLRLFALRFSGYIWASALSMGPPRFFGIRYAGCRPPYVLADIEPAILDPSQHLIAEVPSGSEDLEHYLVVELVTPEFARVELAMLVRGDGWHILDQHVVRRPP
jgi:hypothetical protein